MLQKRTSRLTVAQLQALPKIDLHRHLEGSLRLETLVEIAREFGLDLPAEDVDSLRPHVQVTDDPPDHEVFLSKFGVLRLFYQSPETIYQLAYEAVADAAADNIQYLELRFSPQALARVRGFKLNDVTDWVITAVNQASIDYNIKVSLIITLVRHEPLYQAQQVAEIAYARAGDGILGIDLAGDEVKFPPAPFIPIFKKAKDIGLGVTIHAGEWASAVGVRQAIEELYADRVGHGVRAVEDSQVLHLINERQVALEICLTSNLQTGVIHSIEHHPLKDMMNLNLLATLNTDDPSVSDLTLTDEYEVAVNALDFGYTELRKLILNAAKVSFLPDDQRADLVKAFSRQLPENHYPTTSNSTL
ncbi:MAG: adenosine deaminase [Chloroflexi bacterium]|nr:MAG: adenosine deaminase [Chloroflexota bacterium]